MNKWTALTVCAAGLTMLAPLALLVSSAKASFPGRNGVFVFVSNRIRAANQAASDGDLYTVGTDGKRLRTLTANRNFELYPEWSPRCVLPL